MNPPSLNPWEYLGRPNTPQQTRFAPNPRHFSIPQSPTLIPTFDPYLGGMSGGGGQVHSAHDSQSTHETLDRLKRTLAQTLHNTQTTPSDSELYYNAYRDSAPNNTINFTPTYPQNTLPLLHSMPPPHSAATRFGNRNIKHAEQSDSAAVAPVPGDVRYRPVQNTQNTPHTQNTPGHAPIVDLTGTGSDV